MAESGQLAFYEKLLRKNSEVIKTMIKKEDRLVSVFAAVCARIGIEFDKDLHMEVLVGDGTDIKKFSWVIRK